MTDTPAALDFAPAQPVCFISPHLDDVALSCGQFLTAHPGAHVVTVFAGAPPVVRVDGWNADTTGYSFAPDALQARRAEDEAAMTDLGAHPHWLELWEAEYLRLGRSYRTERSRSDIVSRVLRRAAANLSAARRARIPRLRVPLERALQDVFRELEPASVVAPLGLHHPDHRAVSSACLTMAHGSQMNWYLYLDMPYAQNFPRATRRRLAAVKSKVELDDLRPVAKVGDAKERAIREYRSQVPRLEAGLSTFDRSFSDPERYWRVA